MNKNIHFEKRSDTDDDRVKFVRFLGPAINSFNL
jgi:hypothetical protein